MKKIKYLGLLLFGLTLTGCGEDYLNVEPKSTDNLDTYYHSDAHIQEAVIATYDPLHWVDYDNNTGYTPLNLVPDLMSDDEYAGGGSASDQVPLQKLNNFDADPNNTDRGLWVDFYSGVKRCNDAEKYINDALAAGDDPENFTQDKADGYLAQVRVLRDFYYMTLWKHFGNIPYFTENLSADNGYKAPQLKADEVYNNVVTDLEDVISKYGNKLPMKQDDAANDGRVTKAFAYMIYADLVIYQNDESRYQKALGYLNEIISSGVYSLTPNYADIWDESGEWNEESIFEINYNDNNFQRSWGNTKAVGGTILPRFIGPRDWTSGVGGYDTGWGFGTIRKETYDMFDEGDTRRDASIFNADQVAADNGIDYKANDHGYEQTGYFCNKYAPRPDNVKDCNGDKDLNFNNNLRIYRYAETLLDAAELIVRTGGDNATATRYLNMVRERAGVPDIGSASVDNIITERHFEFVGEGKRYFDLVRSGKAATVLVPDAEGYRTKAWTPNKKYLPIPQTEISADANLVQNDYNN